MSESRTVENCRFVGYRVIVIACACARWRWFETKRSVRRRSLSFMDDLTSKYLLLVEQLVLACARIRRTECVAMRQFVSRGAAIPVIAIVGFAFAAACGSPSRERPGPDAMPSSDGMPACDPAADDDGDCIPNGIEGCQASPPRDSDGDGSPDYLDGESDGDTLPDEDEVGATCDDPRDTDGDGTPDFQDADSDNDGVNDNHEDRNGDGIIGTCTLQCASGSQCPPAAHCSLPADGVGLGHCISLDCADGETDPHNGDTDGDGVDDNLEGTAICNPTSPMNPFGLKPIKYIDSTMTAYPMSNWRLAMDVAAVEGTPSITNPTMLNAAYTFDMIAPDTQVAGFLASRSASANSAVSEIGTLVLNLENAPFISTVTVRASGTNTTSLDGFETVLGTTIELTTSQQLDVTALRKIVTAAALGRPGSDITFPNAGWVGAADTKFILQVQAIRRAEQLQTLFVGGVARTTHADDPTRRTTFHLNDMSNGTGIALSGNGEEIGCEQFLISRQAKADIIWVVDESGSTSPFRTNIANNATLFFNKAVAAGLDFRMGVTDLDDVKNGIFASRQVGGTGDRWLLPAELMAFKDAINDPSGPDAADGGSEDGLTQMRNAMMRHMPRNNADPQMIREDAKLVFIIVTDEKPQEIKDAGILGEGNLQPSPAQQTQIDAFVAPYISQLNANDATVHLIGEPLPFGPACSTEHTYGYYELVNATGGQMGDICQSDLSATLDALIEDIISGSSPLTLAKIPISASVSVSRDTVPLSRSKQTGFDYRGATNAISFYNQFFTPAMPSEITVSYRRWAAQGPIE
ncbi:MAG: hypothetical protein HOV81_40605 [Kofleriaceae bacterium]|nr:hypothetical protein [Kofleriaceae bacterium]